MFQNLKIKLFINAYQNENCKAKEYKLLLNL